MQWKDAVRERHWVIEENGKENSLYRYQKGVLLKRLRRKDKSIDIERFIVNPLDLLILIANGSDHKLQIVRKSLS